MANLLRSLMLHLAAWIFSLVERVYRLFYGLATTRLFNEDAVKTVSNNIYILVSVVVLFAFAIKLLEAIVVPDLLTDSKKGVTGVLKRTVIGLLLIVAIPNMFNLAYYIQREIITSSLVEKVILGHTKTESDPNSTAGVLTSSIIRGFVYPVDDEGVPITESSVCSDTNNCNFADELVGLNIQYQEYVSVIGAAPDYDEIGDLSISKNWENDEPLYETDILPLLLVGIFVLYQVILLAFDAALRLVNLGILEIMAPLIIVAYMGGGNDYLTRWAKMVGEKFASIFVRIAALAFMALGLNLMWNDSALSSDSVTHMFRILVIIGLLRLIKDLPNIIGKIFGVDIKDPGGIKGRLGEMAGIGNLAQKAWTGLGHTATGFAKSVPLALGGLAGTGIKKLDRKFENTIGNGKSIGHGLRWLGNTKAVRGLKVFGAGVKSGGKNTGKAMKDEVDKLFKGEQRRGELKDKEARDKLLARKAVQDAPNIVEIDPNKGTEDYKKTAQNARNAGQDIREINREAINNASVKGIFKDEIRKYSDLLDDSNMANHKLDNKKAILSTIDSMISATKDTEQKARLRNVKAALASGNIKDTYELKQALAKEAVTGDRVAKGGLSQEIMANYFGELENLGHRAGAFESEFDLNESVNVLNAKLEKQKDKVTKNRETVESKDEQEAYDDLLSKIEKREQAKFAVEREVDDAWEYTDVEQEQDLERALQEIVDDSSSEGYYTPEQAERFRAIKRAQRRIKEDRANREAAAKFEASERADELRDKMKTKGYASLTPEEAAELKELVDKWGV